MSWSQIKDKAQDAFDTGPRPGRITAVQGARGIAIFLVFLIHLLELLCSKAPAGSIDAGVLNWIYPLGNLSGAFFVIITGCFLYRSLLEKPVAYGAFLRRRFTRIYSVFLVVLGLYLILSFIFPGESKLPHDPGAALVYILENLLLLPGVLPIRPIITVSWTLSYVALYCILLPPIIEFTGMRGWRSSRRVIFFIASAIVCAAGAQYTSAYVPRLALLPVGALVQEALAWRRANPARMVWLEPVGIGTAALALGFKYWFVHVDHVSIFLVGQGIHQLSLSAVCLFSISFALFSDQRRLATILCSAPPRYLGNMSFSYYLTHSLTIKFLALFGPAVAIVTRSAPGFWLMVPMASAFSLVPAGVLFLAVERRAWGWVRPAPAQEAPASMSATA
jgi:exopolysaccharide production protein ExoZ